MKLLKRIFYTIAFLIVLSCAVVLVFAFSPGLTQSLAAFLHEKGIVSANGNTQSAVPGGDVSSAWDASGIAAGVLAGDNSAGYVAPIRGSLNLPSQVVGLNGYEPVSGSGEELAEDQAEALSAQLGTGESGDGLVFDALLYPYYHMLNSRMQHLYRQIYANALVLNTSFAPLEQVNVAQLKNVFEAVYNDHPELFWMETGYSCKHRSDGTCVEITLIYNRTAQSLEQAKKEFNAQAKAITDGVDPQSSLEEKERYVHDALLKKARYGASAAMNQSAYSALVNGETVCAGYSRAFQYLMQQLGVPCYYCTGYSGEDHAWNIIKLDDGYYNVDTTWDDTEPASYDYFNKTDADFVATHIRTSLSVYLPPCGTGFSNTVPISEAVPSDITLNPNPRQPLRWPEDSMHGGSKGDATDNKEDKKDKDKDKDNGSQASVSGGDVYDLEKAGLTADMVIDSLDKYYANCLTQMKGRGYGQHTFSNIVPKNVLQEVEACYGTGDYKKGYVDEGLKVLGLENYAVQIQVVDLGGNYYRLYHNICIW